MPARNTRSRTAQSGADESNTSKVKLETSQLPTPDSAPAVKTARSSRAQRPPRANGAKNGETSTTPTVGKRKKTTAGSTKQETAAAVKPEAPDANGQEPTPDSNSPVDHPPKRTKPTKGKAPKKPSSKDLNAGAEMAAHFTLHRDTQRAESPSTSSSRSKNNPYGLSPGESPYPTYPHPTPAECEQVNQLLQKAHGRVEAPKTIPTPSLNSSGCGEVPSVLDALIRTRLSAATNNANSSRAFRGLVETFGIIKQGVGKGSVDWDKVRRAPVGEVFKAIQSGGLADVKSRDIQKILNMVHAENQARKSTLQKGEEGKANAAPEAEDEKREEVDKAEHAVLSLDHLHLLTSEDAFNKLIGYPGIGPKTASCVLLFCMQRPSFAVDTHVFRLTRWLGWVPSDQAAKGLIKKGGARSKAVTRESAYAHLDVRVPDELKYPLHYLLIRHGKNCGWCSAKAGRESKVGTCPLAHLMKGKGRSKGLAKKGTEAVEDEDMGEESELESELSDADVKKEEDNMHA